MLGDNVRTYRLALCKSQTELAHECGMANTRVSAIERGTVIPRLPVLIKLADALKVSLDELVGREWVQ